MLQVMSYILPDDFFLELVATMVDGVPNLLNAELPSKEVASLLVAPNFTSSCKESRVGQQGNP